MGLHRAIPTLTALTSLGRELMWGFALSSMCPFYLHFHELRT